MPESKPTRRRGASPGRNGPSKSAKSSIAGTRLRANQNGPGPTISRCEVWISMNTCSNTTSRQMNGIWDECGDHATPSSFRQPWCLRCLQAWVLNRRDRRSGLRPSERPMDFPQCFSESSLRLTVSSPSRFQAQATGQPFTASRVRRSMSSGVRKPTGPTHHDAASTCNHWANFLNGRVRRLMNSASTSPDVFRWKSKPCRPSASAPEGSPAEPTP